MNEQIQEGYMRLLIATNYSSLIFSASRDLFGKGFLSLSIEEKQAVQSSVNNYIQAQVEYITAPGSMEWFLKLAPGILNKPASGEQQNPDPKKGSERHGSYL